MGRLTDETLRNILRASTNSYLWHSPEISAALEELASYRASGLTPEEVSEVAKAKLNGRAIILPKEAHQPMFVKWDAINTFDKWNDTTGAIPNGTSWYGEAQGVIEEIAAMAFGAGIFYQAEKAAEAALGEGDAGCATQSE